MLDTDIPEIDSREIVAAFAVYEEPDDDDERDDCPIGRVEMDGMGQLAVLEAAPTHADFLRRAVERLNEKATITLVTNEPGDVPFSTRALTLSRGEPGFAAELREYARRYYGLLLV